MSFAFDHGDAELAFREQVFLAEDVVLFLFHKSFRQDSNPSPTLYKSVALPDELLKQVPHVFRTRGLLRSN